MKNRFIILALLVFAVAGMLVAPVAAADPTTEVTITKLASDDQTVIDQRTVSWEWMRDNLPVLGDGETMYYTQGPIFEDAWDEVHPGEPYDAWNPTEDVNIEYKDHGEFMGTDVKDLCELVGGADPDEMVEIKARDGLTKKWPAEYIYTPNPKQGPMGIAWHHGKDTGTVEENFREGMRLYFFVETTNNDGMLVWGNWDMHESWDEEYWYYFEKPTLPSASGVSVQIVSDITIHSNDPAPEGWSISLNGSTDRTLTRDEFITLAAAHPASFKTNKFGLLEGADLSAVIGLVDDDDPATVNEALAAQNYTITVYGEKKGTEQISTFYSTEVTDGEKTYVLGNKFDGIELNKTGIDGRVFFPLYLQGTGVDGTQRALEEISKIELDLSNIEPGIDVLYEGNVFLPNVDVTVTSSQGVDYSIPSRTPLGALDTVAATEGFTYAVTDKKWGDSGVLMLDDIGTYPYGDGKSWSCHVNGEVLDDYSNPATDGLNKRVLADGDRVNFYYGPKGATTPESAEASILLTTRLTDAEIVYNGEVTLGDEDVTVTADSGKEYTVCSLTPLGALETVAKAEGLTYTVTDKKWDFSGILLLNDIWKYTYGNDKSWCCYVNGVPLDDFSNPATDGLNTRALADGDRVIFYYGTKGATTPANAEATLLLTIQSTVAPVDWTLSLKGACDETVTKAEFEKALPCKGHSVSWTDPETSDVWAGMPLWMLVAMIDDEESGSHYTFNDDLVAEGYSVKVTSRDGHSINIPSAEIAKKGDSFIVANTLNGETLPQTIGEKEKKCWPLQIKGSAADAGQLVGAIASIELVGLPEPSEGWTLKICGAVNDTITQAEFEEVGCHGTVEYTDDKNRVWSGVPLWLLVGVSDDIETTDHWTFDEDLAKDNYTVRLVSGDGQTQSFGSEQVSTSDGFILANTLNGTPIEETESYPLRIVGENVGAGLKDVAEIDLVDLIPGPAEEGSWNLELKGKIDYTCTEAFFENAASCPYHTLTWTNSKTGEKWGGISLHDLCGWVDDRIPHGPNAFNGGVANAGYTVIVTAGDGFSTEFSSKDIAEHEDDYIVANTLNGTALPKGEKKPWPLRLVGPAVSGSNSVGNIASIELTEFQKPTEIPTVRIVKYAEDRTTVLSEKTVDYTWMKENLKVYGDGETYYRYEGLNFPPNDPWDKDETYPHGYFKIEEQIMGTSVRDLCDLVGGMGPDTEITFAAPDGWETTLHYDNIYAPDERQGEAVLAWYSGGKGYVPDYNDGYRLFFTPEDCIFGQWDMHECIDEKYWHYNSGLPSCAGLSAKYVSEIRIYDVPEPDWNLQLEGAIDKAISKGYFESGLACTMGANHEKSYIDKKKGREWSGMPLWFLLGYVDDENFHTGKSFNADLAAEGYDVHIIGRDGSETVINSRDAMYSDNYILANSLNGLHLDGDDENWPLRLVGENVSGMDTIKGVVKIAFIPSTMEDEVVAIGDIGAGENTTLDLEEGAFSAITITAAGDITDGKLAIRTPDELPNYIDTPAERIYQYLHVVYPAPENTIDEAVITFDLPVSWLRAHEMKTGDVKLMRYTDGAWQTLKTTYVKEENGKAYFNAVTDKFCYFAVGGTPPSKPISGITSSSGGKSSDISAFAASFKPDETKTFLVGETAIAKITVTAYEEVSDFLVTVKKAHLGNDVQMPDGQVYELQEVTLYHADPAALDGITLEFTVPSTWLENHDVEAGDVVMLRYVDGAWKHLDTTLVSEENDKAVYRADSPGFSYFAIATMKGGAAEPEETHPSVEAPVETPTAPVNQTADETTVPTTAPTKTPVFWGLPLIALGALLILRRE